MKMSFQVKFHLQKSCQSGRAQIFLFLLSLLIISGIRSQEHRRPDASGDNVWPTEVRSPEDCV